MIGKILQGIKETPMTISGWMAGFVGIFFVRYLFESLSNPTSSGIIPSDVYTVVHVGLFFLCVTLGTSCIVGFFSRDYINSAKIVLFALPAIWIAPIIDIFLSHGKGFKMTYIFDTSSRLLLDFLTFFGPNLDHGATYGIRIGILIILCGVVWYLWTSTKNLSRTILGGIVVYAFGFIMASIPGILYTLSHVTYGSENLPEVLSYLEKIVTGSNISHNTLREGVSFVSTTRFFELGFDKLISQILFILSCLFATILFWEIDRKKFGAIIKNMRLERIGSYLTLLLCGSGFAYLNQLGGQFVWVDVLGFLCLIFSWIGLWMYAVHSNDIADVDIDLISNTERPLVKKVVDEKNMRETGYVWLALALLGSWCAGFYPFFMSLVYVFTSHIYSAPPLRLRRFPMVSSFLIGVACLATVLAGFFFVSMGKQIQIFPMLLSIGIVVMVTLAINVKDMKDIEGDTASGIVTLPILFGKNGARAVGICFALSFLLVPMFLSFYFLYIIAIPTAIIGYRLVNRKPYHEEPIFVLRFIFLALVGLLYFGIYWLGHIYNLM